MMEPERIERLAEAIIANVCRWIQDTEIVDANMGSRYHRIRSKVIEMLCDFGDERACEGMEASAQLVEDFDYGFTGVRGKEAAAVWTDPIAKEIREAVEIARGK